MLKMRPKDPSLCLFWRENFLVSFSSIQSRAFSSRKDVLHRDAWRALGVLRPFHIRPPFYISGASPAEFLFFSLFSSNACFPGFPPSLGCESFPRSPQSAIDCSLECAENFGRYSITSDF